MRLASLRVPGWHRCQPGVVPAPSQGRRPTCERKRLGRMRSPPHHVEIVPSNGQLSLPLPQRALQAFVDEHLPLAGAAARVQIGAQGQQGTAGGVLAKRIPPFLARLQVAGVEELGKTGVGDHRAHRLGELGTPESSPVACRVWLMNTRNRQPVCPANWASPWARSRRQPVSGSSPVAGRLPPSRWYLPRIRSRVVLRRAPGVCQQQREDPHLLRSGRCGARERGEIVEPGPRCPAVLPWPVLHRAPARLRHTELGPPRSAAASPGRGSVVGRPRASANPGSARRPQWHLRSAP
jgi:hypothetical protein